MHDAAGYRDLLDVGQLPLQRNELGGQSGLVDDAAVVMNLQRADPWRELLNATQALRLQRFHQQMDPQPQPQIQHVRAVLNQDVLVAGLPVSDLRPARRNWQCRQYAPGLRAIRRGRFGRWTLRLLQRLDCQVLGLLEREGLFEANAPKAQRIAGLDLSHFPQLGLRDGHRADEAPQARSIAGEDHRRIASKIDAANRVYAVMNIRRV